MLTDQETHATAEVRAPSLALVEDVRSPVRILFNGIDGALTLGAGDAEPPAGWGLRGELPALYPEWLGSREFCARHGTRFAYVGGAMAHGISSVRLTAELARAGCLGFFGSAGLAQAEVAHAITALSAELDSAGLPWGVNLIHSPEEPSLEEELVDLFLARGVHRVCASAFMGLSKAAVRYTARGLTRGDDGQVVRKNFIFAKVSRPEVARHFLAPPPAELLASLAAAGLISRMEAALAAEISVASEVTVEADSGGHTDNRPLAVIFPVIAGLRDQLARRHGLAQPPAVGAAGGLGTPSAVAAAFALGADYVMVGSVHQACVESGVSDDARALLATAGLADFAMTAAADMFEQGVKVQVLKRGTQMAQHGNRLYALWRRHGDFDAIPAEERSEVEQTILGESFASAWSACRDYLVAQNKLEALNRCESDPAARFARVCKRYLAATARWPLAGGDSTRRTHYQLWCGPALGAFNDWSRGSFLAVPAARTVAQVALNFLEGAAVVARAQQLRALGVPVPTAAFSPVPQRLAI
jgi:PfaD family protein